MPRQFLKLFFDESLTKPVTRFEFPDTTIGESSIIQFFVYNSSAKWPTIDIHAENMHKETTLSNLPTQLQPKEAALVQYKWTPSLDIDDPPMTILRILGDTKIGGV